MSNIYDYSFMYDQAINRIRNIRLPSASLSPLKDFQWDTVREQQLFNFGEIEQVKPIDIFTSARNISISCFEFIIDELIQKYNCPLRKITIDTSDKLLRKAKFAYVDKQCGTLLIFEDIGECPIWKSREKEPTCVNEIMSDHGCTSCKYVIMMYDYAYLEIIGHDDNKNDPGRGFNYYSIKWFFEQYITEEDYYAFELASKKYTEDVKRTIGFITVKMLSADALINFKRRIERTLVNYPFEDIKKIACGNYQLTDEKEYNKLKKQFTDDRIMRIILGDHDFADSLITAEWLLDSMSKAEAIDLTCIAMGYFKTIEQLLCELILIYQYPEVSDVRTIEIPEERQLDYTIGNMAIFVRDHLDNDGQSNHYLIRNDIRFATKKYVREAIFAYKELRNGYLHKDNIKELNKIEEIRTATINILFLIFGAFDIDDSTKEKLGYVKQCDSDYYLLCEYMNYHLGDIFLFESEGKKVLFKALPDPLRKIGDSKIIQYSALYFDLFPPSMNTTSKPFRFTEKELPNTISLCELKIDNVDRLSCNFNVVKKIFEAGKYVGPQISEELSMKY